MLLGLRLPPSVCTRVPTVSSPASSPREPQNPTLDALRIKPGRGGATGTGILSKYFTIGCRHLGRPARQAGPGPRGGASSLGSSRLQKAQGTADSG